MSSDKFQNKYRIPSARAKWWDYGNNAAYFITICTAYRKNYFGRIINGKMALSDIGKIADDCWMNIPKHFPFVDLGEFVVMPNHVHGIIIINKPAMVSVPVETQNFASLQPTPKQSPPLNKFGPQSQNLASIIRGFKIGVTQNAHLIHAGFAWQTRFHDHIIRNHNEYQRIAWYIMNNPANWANDKFRKKNAGPKGPAPRWYSGQVAPPSLRNLRIL
jgi:REP element-mobilizing transposase RayT